MLAENRESCLGQFMGSEGVERDERCLRIALDVAFDGVEASGDEIE